MTPPVVQIELPPMSLAAATRYGLATSIAKRLSTSDESTGCDQDPSDDDGGATHWRCHRQNDNAHQRLAGQRQRKQTRPDADDDGGCS